MTREVTHENTSAPIERRASRRRTAALKVSLYYDRLGLLTCKTRNISIEGLLLDTGRVRLSQSAQVEVVLTDPADNYRDPIRVFARVNRVNESMAALAFHDLEIEAFRRLKTLVSAMSGNS